MIDLRRRPQQVSAAEGRPITARLRHLVYLLGVPILLIAVMAAAVLQIHNNRVDRLTLILGPAADANGLVLQTMVDASIGLRFPPARELLTPHRVAEARTMATLATLEDKLMLSSPRNAALRTSLEGQRLAVEQWWAYASSTKQAAGRGDRVDARHGYVLFDSFRRANAALREYLNTEHGKARSAIKAAGVVGMTIIGVALTVLLVALVLGVRFARSIGQPIAELRGTMARQREGEPGALAREDLGPLEVRSLAADFNALTKENLCLQQTQARSLRMHELTFEIERAMRSASDTQQALDVMCAMLGKELGADRVLGHSVNVDRNVVHNAQWHLPDLPPLGDTSHYRGTPRVGQLAKELWQSSKTRALNDYLGSEAAFRSKDRAQNFQRATGARAIIFAPIELLGRVLGMIYVIMVNQPREWTTVDADAVQQIAAFVAQILMEEELQNLQNEHIGQLEWLDQQKTDFLATVSHELRTPLTSISGYLELLQDGDIGELTGKQHLVLEVIDRNTSRLTSLIGDLLMLNQIESGGFKGNVTVVSMRELITHACEELQPLASSGAVEINIDAGPEAAMVQGDREHLCRAVTNIISNAIKFSHPGGVVSVSCVLDQDARRVIFTCQDRGIGIPADDQAQLFTRFYRGSNATDQAIAGTGLGLVIAKQLIEDNDGELRLTSVAGEGTTVVIDLPLSARD